MENLFEYLKIATAILGSLGGGAVIVFGFSNWLGKIWADRLMRNETARHNQELESLRNRLLRETETFKLELKKAEFFFRKEFEATSELVALMREVEPVPFFEEMEWSDACDHIALNFKSIERNLHSYLAKYGAVLPNDVRKLLEECLVLAGIHKPHELDVSRQANEAADKLYKRMKNAESIMLVQVRRQSQG
jgi:hypothetical protein